MQILFLCTGNYYRSRFAEAVFNHHAELRELPVFARSRGLATHLVKDFPDRLSPDTEAALARRGIPLSRTGSHPCQVDNTDLAVAHHIIALKESEHRDMLRLLHPGWETRTEFWHIHDLDDATPETQLPLVETAVMKLLDRCEKSCAPGHFAHSCAHACARTGQ